MPKPGCALIGGTMAAPGGAAPGAPGAPGAAPAWKKTGRRRYISKTCTLFKHFPHQWRTVTICASVIIILQCIMIISSHESLAIGTDSSLDEVWYHGGGGLSPCCSYHGGSWCTPACGSYLWHPVSTSCQLLFTLRVPERDQTQDLWLQNSCRLTDGTWSHLHTIMSYPSMFRPTQAFIELTHTYFFFTPRSEQRKERRTNYISMNVFMRHKNDWAPDRKRCSLPPIRLASEESRSPPMVLLGGGVAGGAAVIPPTAMGVPMLPAVLPAVLPPVLWGVTAGISKAPNPSNTWWREGGNDGTAEKQHRLQICKSLI